MYNGENGRGNREKRGSVNCKYTAKLARPSDHLF